ncbi:MAG: hypothetical protein RI539_07165 [Spiribacter sp.]|jgi:hypothetical protein|nr:hypothetical protein [Spiribacter sp.]MDR9490105.1 hypothetical protein [Spiribacter sp.]
MPSALSATPAVLTVEINAAAIMQARPPEPLNRDSAELLAGPIADDLRRIIGEEVAEAGLIFPAALYDLTELLQPGLPMVETLLDLYRGSLRGGPFSPQLLAIGSSGGRFPQAAIAPRRRPGAGPLLALPFALVAPGDQLDPLRRTIETVLLEKGRASLETDRAVRQLLGVEPVNLSYATFNDLSALMKVQLEHAEFGPLWQLIEAGLYRPESVEEVTLNTGNRFITTAGEVWTPWLTFDGLANQHQNDRETSEQTYTEWARIQRQYMAGLNSHGLPTHIFEPVSGTTAADLEVALSIAKAHTLSADTRWYREVIAEIKTSPDTAVVTLTEQLNSTLGPIAYTALIQATDGKLLGLVHDYPTDPSGINAVIDEWKNYATEHGATFHIERPGALTTIDHPPRLQPWLDYQGSA